MFEWGTSLYAIVFSLGFAFEVKTRLGERVLNLGAGAWGRGGSIFFFRLSLVEIN